MKKIIISIFIVLFFVGCTNKTNDQKENEEDFVTYNELELNTDIDDNPNREHIINKKINYSSNDVVSPIGEIIKENVYKDFDINDYVVESSKSEQVDENGNKETTYIYDYVFTLGGAKTELAYTVFVENNVVTKIYDNMQGYDAAELKKSSKAEEISTRIKNLTEERKEKMRKIALKDDSNSKITSEHIRYDVKKDRLYYSFEITHSVGDSEMSGMSVYNYNIKL